MMKISKRLFCLSFFPTVVISLPSFGFLIYTFTAKDVSPAAACLAYFLSAYALTIVITFIVRMVLLTGGNVKNLPAVKKLYQIPGTEKYMTDKIYRAGINLYGGLIINFGYVVLNGVLGVLNRSEWLITLSIYYFLLSLMRFSLLLHFNRKPVGREIISEFRRYRLCGILLLFMNGALAAIVARIVNDHAGYSYNGIMIYVMAVYAFYAVTTAGINLVKFRRFGSPVLSAVKAVSLTSALVSMLSLETAMLEQFGSGNSENFRRLMTSFTGGGICVIEIGIAVFMIMRANSNIKRLEQQHGSK